MSNRFIPNARRLSKITRMTVSEASICDRPANEFCTAILRKSAGSDRVGVQDDRDEGTKANELEQLLREGVKLPPGPAETCGQWLTRVFGADGVAALHGSELSAIGALYSKLREHGSVSKSLASLHLDALAAAMQRQHPTVTIEKAFAMACGEPEGAEAYATMRGRPMDVIHSAAGRQLERIAKAENDGSEEEEQSHMTSDELDNGEAADAADSIQEEADTIRAQMGVSPEKAYLIACQRHPDLYKQARSHRRAMQG